MTVPKIGGAEVANQFVATVGLADNDLVDDHLPGSFRRPAADALAHHQAAPPDDEEEHEQHEQHEHDEEQDEEGVRGADGGARAKQELGPNARDRPRLRPSRPRRGQVWRAARVSLTDSVR